jgi:molybdopterin converting factor small subunit
MLKKVQIFYFAKFKTYAGKESEILETSAEDLLDLYAEISQRYAFGMDAPKVRAAINDEFSPWNTKIVDGNQIVFIPPVAGG